MSHPYAAWADWCWKVGAYNGAAEHDRATGKMAGRKPWAWSQLPGLGTADRECHNQVAWWRDRLLHIVSIRETP